MSKPQVRLRRIRIIPYRQGSKKTGRAQSATEMRTMTATKIVTSTIIRDCDHCVQLPLEEPQSESEEKNDCDCEW